MFSKYYQSELTYLRELGREFSTANPSLAGMFAERGADPDVERLLEGFAFLTARIRERIDDAVPEIVEALAELTLPHCLRTVPACSVVEFQPHATALRERMTLAAGTELGAREVDGTSCIFRTARELDLLPLTLLDASLDHSREASPAIRVKLRCNESGRPAVFEPAGFRLFLHGGLSLASTLLVWFREHLTDVVLHGSGDPVSLGKDCVRPTPFGSGAPALLPWPRYAPEGSRALQEYFSFPPAYLFFDVANLDRAGEAAADEFQLEFRFQRPPKLPERIEKDVFRLHCTPVVNLFEASADPIERHPSQHEYLLRAGGYNPRHTEIFEVHRVQGLRSGRQGRRSYAPFFGFAHASLPKPEQAYFVVRRRRSPIDGGIDGYLALMTPRDVAPDLEHETLSIDLTCTNRTLPAELRVGDISVPTPQSPGMARFRNITPVSRPVPPPLGSELHWRLVGHLAMNLRSLGDPAALRSILALYNFHGDVDQQLGRANELRIEGIRDVRIEPARRLLDNVPVRGTQTTLELEESSYADIGDALLFASACEALLADRVTINSFNQMTVRLHPSGAEWTWPPRSGTDPML